MGKNVAHKVDGAHAIRGGTEELLLASGGEWSVVIFGAENPQDLWKSTKKAIADAAATIKDVNKDIKEVGLEMPELKCYYFSIAKCGDGKAGSPDFKHGFGIMMDEVHKLYPNLGNDMDGLGPAVPMAIIYQNGKPISIIEGLGLGIDATIELYENLSRVLRLKFPQDDKGTRVEGMNLGYNEQPKRGILRN